MTWMYDPDRLAASLEQAGFDVNRAAARLEHGGSLEARRDRDGSSLTIAVNAGGQIRVTRTVSLGQPEVGSQQLGGVTLRSISEQTRQESATGALSAVEQLDALLSDLLARERGTPAGDGTGGPW